jgi:hypothetical protein
MDLPSGAPRDRGRTAGFGHAGDEFASIDVLDVVGREREVGGAPTIELVEHSVVLLTPKTQTHRVESLLADARYLPSGENARSGCSRCGRRGSRWLAAAGLGAANGVTVSTLYVVLMLAAVTPGPATRLPRHRARRLAVRYQRS